MPLSYVAAAGGGSDPLKLDVAGPTFTGNLSGPTLSITSTTGLGPTTVSGTLNVSGSATYVSSVSSADEIIARYNGGIYAAKIGYIAPVAATGISLGLEDAYVYRAASGVLRTNAALTVDGATTLSSTLKVVGNVGFYNTTPVAQPTGVAVTDAGIHAALVTLGLITA